MDQRNEIPEMKTSCKYATEFCERLEDSLKLTQEELQKAQKHYKKHYDKNAKPRNWRPSTDIAPD